MIVKKDKPIDAKKKSAKKKKQKEEDISPSSSRHCAQSPLSVISVVAKSLIVSSVLSL